MKKILAADFWLVFNFDDPNKRYQKFLNRGRGHFKRLIESLLLYDNIVIPTQDYLSLSVLIGVLGEDEVIELLKGKSISFLRLKGALAYIGNGGGVRGFLIGDGSNKKLHSFCAPAEEAINWAISGLEQKPRNSRLPQLVYDATTEIEISSLEESIRHETYQDILKDNKLREQFALRNTDLDRLAGINPDQVRIYGGSDAEVKGDEIDFVMALTATNLELRMMQLSQCDDSSTDNPIRSILEAKALRTLQRSPSHSFTELKELTDLPDVGEIVLKKEISLYKIHELSKSNNGQKFRKWFHENCRKDTVTTAKEYADLLKEIPLIQKVPARLLRFLITNLVGIANPAAGLGAGIVDSFFIEKLFRGSSPKFFIDDLNNLTSKSRK